MLQKFAREPAAARREPAVWKELGSSGVLGVWTQQQQQKVECELVELVFTGAVAQAGKLEQWVSTGGVGAWVGVLEGAASVYTPSSSSNSSSTSSSKRLDGSEVEHHRHPLTLAKYHGHSPGMLCSGVASLSSSYMMGYIRFRFVFCASCITWYILRCLVRFSCCEES